MIKKALGILLSAMLIITSISAAAVSVSAAEGDPTFVVAGSSESIFGMTWNETFEDNQMTQKQDGTYEKVYTNVGPENNVQIKVVENPANGGAAIWHGDSTGNNFTVNITDVSDLVVTYNPTTQVVTVSGTYVKDTVLNIERIVAAGNGDPTADPNFLNGIGWDPAASENEMTEVEPGIYEITFEHVSENMGYQVKFTDGSWVNNWGGDFVGSGIETTADYNGANITFDVDEDDSTVVLRLDLTEFDLASRTGAKFTITINDEVMETEVEDANLKFKNYSLSLASNIEMNFNVNESVLAGLTDPYVVVNCAGDETVLTDYTTANGVYTFKFNKIYPQLLGEDVTAVLHAKDGIVDHYSAPYTKSVKGYCNNQFSRLDHAQWAKFHTLLVNLLNYGANAQTYVNYKTNDLANKDLTAEQQSWALTDVGTLNNVRNYNAEVIDNPTVTFSAASLSLGSTVGISIQFTTPDVDNTKIVATVRGTSYEFTSEDFVDGTNGRKKLIFNNLLANDMRETVTFKAYVNDVLASNTATYSIESYVSGHTNDGNNLANLLNSMYLYGEAAKAYAAG
ncbi:MAG: hypothetical protein U0L58_10940 [Ruminococcus sp.]|nr:hypothetical protein [Ruminococcus sp.]